MRIVHFTGAFLPTIGGASFGVHNLAFQQTKAGHDVYVLTGWSRRKKCLRKQVPYKLLSLPPGFRMDELFKRSSGRMILLGWLWYLQKRFSFDAWNLHYAYPIGSALPLLQKLGIEPVLTCRGGDINTLPEIEYGYRLDPEIDKEVLFVLRNCRKLVALGNSMRKCYVEAGCNVRRISIIPNGIYPDRMNSISHNKAQQLIRNKYHLPPGAKIILTVGRNHPVKRFDLIPKIITYLATQIRDFVWLIVGDGCEDLLDGIEDPSIAQQLRICKPMGASKSQNEKILELPDKELIETIRAADVFVFPTRIEGLPQVVLQALAAGAPVVSTDVPGVRDLVESGVDGFLSREGDAEDMAKNIVTLLSDPQMRKEMGATGQQKARRYDWAIVAQQYVDLYSR